MTPPLPPASLIICSRNRERLLLDTVRSILAGDERPAEMVIVDQSDHPSPELPHLGSPAGCDIRYIHPAEPGASRARNRGAALASHDVLVFTDDDMLAPPAWYGTLVRRLMEAGPGAVVTGQVVAAAPDGPDTFAPSVRHDDQPKVYRGRIAADVLSSGNMAIRRSLLQQAGGFDARLGPGTPFPAAEDNDLGYRLLKRGCLIVYAPEATLYHRAWRTSREYARHCWGYERGQGAFYAKHLGLRDSFMLRRMAGQVWRQFVRMARTSPLDWRKTWVRAVSVMALLWGAMTWTMAHGLRESEVPN